MGRTPKIGGRLKGGVFEIAILILHNTDFFLKVGGRLQGGVVLKEGFYGRYLTL